jgi:hypothetical protein
VLRQAQQPAVFSAFPFFAANWPVISKKDPTQSRELLKQLQAAKFYFDDLILFHEFKKTLHISWKKSEFLGGNSIILAILCGWSCF